MSILRIKGDDGVIIDSQTFLELPKSPTATSTGITRVGMMRYNTALSSFEGVIQFTDGTVGYRRFPNLDQNGRLLTSQLPDSITSGLKYAGTYNPVTDDIDPPSTPGVYTALPAVAGASQRYFIVRGIFDLAAKHFAANSPRTSPATFTPVNPNGSVNWMEIKYYFNSTGVVAAFGRIIAASVNAQAHPGLTLLSADTTLCVFASTQNTETALSDGDWVVNSGTTWQRLRQTRISILAGAVQVDNSRVMAASRPISGSDTGTVQAYLDGLTTGTIRRTGDSLIADGSSANGRVAFTYGTATAPAITFNNVVFNPDNSSGMDASLWSDPSTGIFHPGAGLISFTSSGTERFRITSTGTILYQAAGINTATSAALQLNSSTNTNVIGFTGYNNKLYMTVGGAAQGILDATGLTILGTVNSTGGTLTGNTVIGTTSADLLTVNSTAKFASPVTFNGITSFNAASTFANNMTVNGNVTIGNDTGLSTLFVLSSSNFNSTATFGADVNIIGSTTMSGDINLGDDDTNTIIINGSTSFIAPSTFDETVTINGDVTLGSDSENVITVNGKMTFTETAPVTVNSDLTVNGNIVLGDSSTDTMTVTAESDFISPVKFAGPTTLSGNVSIGETDAETLNVISTSTFSSPVTMTDSVTLNGNVSLGDASTDTFTVKAKSTFSSLVTFTGEVVLNDKTTIGEDNTDTLTINSASTFSSAATFKKEVVLNDKVTVGKDETSVLDVKSSSTFSAEVTLSDKVTIGTSDTDTLDVKSASTFSAPVTLSDTVTIEGDATIGIDSTGTFTVQSSSVFVNDINMKGNVTLGDDETDILVKGKFTASAPVKLVSTVYSGDTDVVVSKIESGIQIELPADEEFVIKGSTDTVASIGSYGVVLPVIDTSTATVKEGSIAYDSTKSSVYAGVGTEWIPLGASESPVSKSTFDSNWTTDEDNSEIYAEITVQDALDATVYENKGDFKEKRTDVIIRIYDDKIRVVLPSTGTSFEGTLVITK